MNQFFSLHIPKNINAMIAIRFCCLKFVSVHELISVCMGVLCTVRWTEYKSEVLIRCTQLTIS